MPAFLKLPPSNRYARNVTGPRLSLGRQCTWSTPAPESSGGTEKQSERTLCLSGLPTPPHGGSVCVAQASLQARRKHAVGAQAGTRKRIFFVTPRRMRRSFTSCDSCLRRVRTSVVSRSLVLHVRLVHPSAALVAFRLSPAASAVTTGNAPAHRSSAHMGTPSTGWRAVVRHRHTRQRPRSSADASCRYM